jgi:hypothetical protein
VQFKRVLMIGVFAVWSIYVGLTTWRGEEPPLPVWMVPSATYTALTGQIPGMRRDETGTPAGTDEGPRP